MGMVLRLLYNNSDYQGPCKNPGKDPLCLKCYEGKVQIESPGENDIECHGSCWERDLRINYEWGCTPEYKKFNPRKAYKGAKVFFVFGQPDSNYTLWAKTTIKDVNVKPLRKMNPNEGHYEYFLRFQPFQPLDRNRWVKNLTARELVGTEWRQGRFRYITSEQETTLDKLIEGHIPERKIVSQSSYLPSDNIVLNLTITNTMHSKLESVANEDGRHIDEIVREAIAEWLNERRR